jgi:quercetin dioxygenase-like cupin family protein
MTRLVAFIAWTALVYIAASGQNPAHVKPNSYTTVIDNPQVQVVRSIHAPHEQVPMHSHQSAVVVYLTDVHERSTDPDGTSKVVHHKAGDVLWSPAHTHALENLSDKPIEVIEIEPKGR